MAKITTKNNPAQQVMKQREMRAAKIVQDLVDEGMTPQEAYYLISGASQIAYDYWQNTNHAKDRAFGRELYG